MQLDRHNDVVRVGHRQRALQLYRLDCNSQSRVIARVKLSVTMRKVREYTEHDSVL